MGFKYQKRVNLGKGVGLNVSKSGVSPSIRTQYGSISPKGFSIRTGIPGLSYRSKSKDAAGIMLIVGILAIGFLFVRWLVQEVYHFVLRRKMDMQMRKLQNMQANNSSVTSGTVP